MTKPAKTRSLPMACGTNGTPSFFSSSSYSLAVGGRIDRLAGLGELVDAGRQHQAQVQADQRDDQAGDDEDVQGEEARQRLAADDRAAEQQRR